jgi:sulfonate transport system ATP-binding protein
MHLCWLVSPNSHGRIFAVINIQQSVSDSQERSMSITAINARNQFKGIVKEIIRGPVLSEVDVETAAGIVTSVITSRSIDSLDIRVGDEVLTVFKSTEVLLAKF